MPDYDYPNGVRDFSVRFLTGLCAPGFMFLMGFGIYAFGESRRRAGWSELKITRHFVIRGSLLILINFIQVFMFISWAPVATVLYALGLNIILGSLIVSFDEYITRKFEGKHNRYIASAVYIVSALVISVIVTEQTRNMAQPDMDNLPETNLWNLMKETVSFGGQIVAIYTPLPWMPAVLWGTIKDLILF
jgi:hypothetical protein